MRRLRSVLSHTGLAAGLALALLSPGCNESDGPTAPRLAEPTPTPAAAEGISGLWIGTFTTNDEADCHSDPNARASFAQTGAEVTGTIQTIQNTCGFGGTFRGTIAGERLSGTLTKGNFGPATLTGTVSAAGMNLSVSDLRTPPGPDGTGLMIPGGTLELSRP